MLSLLLEWYSQCPENSLSSSGITSLCSHLLRALPAYPGGLVAC